MSQHTVYPQAPTPPLPLIYSTKSMCTCVCSVYVIMCLCLYVASQSPLFHEVYFNPIKHLWDELERRLRARPNRSTSVPNLTNALVAEWKQVPVAMFLHLLESLPIRVEAVIAAMFQHLVESLPRRVEAVMAAMFQHLVESLPRIVEAVNAEKGGPTPY